MFIVKFGFIYLLMYCLPEDTIVKGISILDLGILFKWP